MHIVNTWHTMKAMVDSTKKAMKRKIGLSLLQRKLRISQIPTRLSFLNAESNSIVIEFGRFSRFNFYYYSDIKRDRVYLDIISEIAIEISLGNIDGMHLIGV